MIRRAIDHLIRAQVGICEAARIGIDTVGNPQVAYAGRHGHCNAVDQTEKAGLAGVVGWAPLHTECHVLERTVGNSDAAAIEHGFAAIAPITHGDLISIGVAASGHRLPCDREGLARRQRGGRFDLRSVRIIACLLYDICHHRHGRTRIVLELAEGSWALRRTEHAAEDHEHAVQQEHRDEQCHGQLEQAVAVLECPGGPVASQPRFVHGSTYVIYVVCPEAMTMVQLTGFCRAASYKQTTVAGVAGAKDSVPASPVAHSLTSRAAICALVHTAAGELHLEVGAFNAPSFAVILPSAPTATVRFAVIP